MYAYLYNPQMYKILLYNRVNSLYFNFYAISQYIEGNKDIRDDGKEYTEFEYHSDIKYLMSVLKAIQLLSLFIDDKHPTASYVVHQARRVIEGHRSMEDFLSDVGVTYDSAVSSKNFEKVLKKNESIISK